MLSRYIVTIDSTGIRVRFVNDTVLAGIVASIAEWSPPVVLVVPWAAAVRRIRSCRTLHPGLRDRIGCRVHLKPHARGEASEAM